MASTVKPLVVGMGPSYAISTPFIPGVPPDDPLYTMETAVIPGQPDEGPTTYTMSTPYIPGFPPEETTRYNVPTPVIPGVELDLDEGPDHLDETYPRPLRNRRVDQHELLTVDDHMDETFLRTTLSPPSIADHMDETFLPTRITRIDHGVWDLDETYEPTTLIVSSATVDVSPVTFPPVRRTSTSTVQTNTVQPLTTLLYPGPDLTVVFPRLPYQLDYLGIVG